MKVGLSSTCPNNMMKSSLQTHYTTHADCSNQTHSSLTDVWHQIPLSIKHTNKQTPTVKRTNCQIDLFKSLGAAEFFKFSNIVQKPIELKIKYSAETRFQRFSTQRFSKAALTTKYHNLWTRTSYDFAQSDIEIPFCFSGPPCYCTESV